MIRICDLHFGYTDQPVLCGINLEIRQGEILGVLGPNGCGKSTLLRLLRGVLTPERGQVLWNDRDVARFARKEMARQAAVVPQSLALPFPYPVAEMVMMGRFAHQAGLAGPTTADRHAVEQALAVTDTLHLRERSVIDLSGGELQRVLLARALAQQTPVLLLDEATSHLDLDHRLEIADLLVRLNRDSEQTVVQVSHDLDLAAETSDRVLLLSADGRVAACGPPAEVLTATSLKEVFRVDVKVEANPYTGAPRIFPLKPIHHWQGAAPRVHLICGGGSGGELLRRLQTAGCTVTAGPLNQGDSDQILAAALSLETVQEKPFSAISPAALTAARQLCSDADLLIVAPTCWGAGNLEILDLVSEQLQARPVLLVAPAEKQDFADGRAWQQLEALRQAGATVLPDTADVLRFLTETSLDEFE